MEPAQKTGLKDVNKSSIRYENIGHIPIPPHLRSSTHKAIEPLLRPQL
jgi:hypothetical protein